MALAGTSADTPCMGRFLAGNAVRFTLLSPKSFEAGNRWDNLMDGAVCPIREERRKSAHHDSLQRLSP